MKDNLSLIAAAAGGFMLAIAASGIIHAAPITSSNTPLSQPNPQPPTLLCALRASVVR